MPPDLAEKNAKAEAALAIAAPKAAALDRIAQETEGAVCLRVAAKLTQVPEKQYLRFLNGERWIFRHHHSMTWQGHVEKEQAGLSELKRTRVTRDDGSEKTVEQVLITPRGLAKAAELIAKKEPHLRKTVLPPIVVLPTPPQPGGQCSEDERRVIASLVNGCLDIGGAILGCGENLLNVLRSGVQRHLRFPLTVLSVLLAIQIKHA